MSKLIKKDSKFTIVEIGLFNTSKIKLDVDSFSSEWDLDPSRQNKNMVHRNTKMYQLRYFSYDWILGQPIDIQEVNKMTSKDAQDQLEDIYKEIETYYNGKVVRAEIIRMMPNVKIPRHVDGGEMLTVTRRCHIPITTSDEVYFNVFGNAINMKVGRGYEINNLLPHSVENNSSIERDHLILDILPLEML